MGNHVCDNSKLIIQVTGHGHDNPKKQPQQLMFYKDNYQTPLNNVKAQETTTKLQEDNYPSKYECPSILFEYPECDVKDNQLAIKIPKENGGDIILPLLDKVIGGTTDIDNNGIYKSHRLLAIVPMVTISSIPSVHTNYTSSTTSAYVLTRPGYFYVFIDGKLWRELKIEYQQNKPQFKDIDLKDYENQKGYREATGKALNDIWIPATFPRKGFIVQLAYSEEQLSFERINYLQNHSDELRHRCSTLTAATSIAKANTHNIPFSLTDLKPHRPRNFDDEMMLDNPYNYLTNLGKDYLKNVMAVNQNAYAACSKKATYAIFDINYFALPNHCSNHFETGAWSSIIYNNDAKDNEELSKIAEFWPKPDNDYSEYKENIPEKQQLQSPQEKGEDGLESFKQRYIVGALVQDPLYEVHHLQQRIAAATQLIQKMPKLAEKRPVHFLASLVNSQRRYFNGINSALKSVGNPVQQNFAHSICEVERLATVAYAERCQNILAKAIQRPITQMAMADLLSDHTPIEYAGHVLFILTALKAIAYPAQNYDELSYTSFTRLSEGQQYINSLRKGFGRGLNKLIETQKADEEILKELEEYMVSSTEPTDNPGDGSFRYAVLKELNKQIQFNTYSKPISYNGKIFEEISNKLDKEVLENKKAQQQKSDNTSAIISGLQSVASILTQMQMMLHDAYVAAHQAAANARNITKTQIDPNTKTARKAANIEKVQTDLENLEITRSIHAKAIYSLREIIPDLFKDMAFVPMEKNGLLLNPGATGDSLVAVDDVVKQITNRTITDPQYSSKVRLIKFKAGSQLQRMAWAMKNVNPFPRVGDILGSEGYQIAAEQVWQDYYKTLNYKPSNYEGEATNIAKMRQNYIDAHQEDILYRAFLNKVDAEIASGNVIDYGQGELKEIFDKNINQKIDTDVADIQNKAELEVQRGTHAAKLQHEAAATVSATEEAHVIEKLLRSKYAAGLFLAFEIWNIRSFSAGYQDLEDTRSSLRLASGRSSVGIDTINASLLLIERTALNHKQWLTNVLKANWKNISVSGALATVGLLLTAGNGLSDAFYELTEGHPERAALQMLVVAGAGMMMFSGKLAAATVLIGLGPVGWLVLGLAVVIGGSIALAVFQADQMEDWLRQGPFADFTAEWLPYAKGHLQSYEEAYYRFLSLISGISIKVEKNDQYRSRSLVNPTDAELRIQQAKYKVTVSSNLPGLVNMQPQNNMKVEFQASFRPLTVGGRIGRYIRQLHEETTLNGKVYYLDYKYPEGAAGCQIDVWAQFAADINYFGITERRYFPAPPPNKGIVWDEKYQRPDKQADNTPFWYSASFDEPV